MPAAEALVEKLPDRMPLEPTKDLFASSLVDDSVSTALTCD